MPNILMQSTSVDVVSVNPAAGAESFGQALYPVRDPGRSAVTLGAHAAAEAVWGTKDTVAHTTATLSSSAVRFLKLVSISPPCS
jgi:hypothetical protein